MFRLFNRMARGYERYMTHRGREMARNTLLGYSDRMLADNGFSRELLEQGVRAWPWLSQPKQLALQPASENAAARQQAIQELSSLSDRELQDLGIARSQIFEAVHSGRPGLDVLPGQPRVAA